MYSYTTGFSEAMDEALTVATTTTLVSGPVRRHLTWVEAVSAGTELMYLRDPRACFFLQLLVQVYLSAHASERAHGTCPFQNRTMLE